ncbi:MAG: hypothetical protein AAF570_17435 [Bacteroidota bacterium]
MLTKHMSQNSPEHSQPADSVSVVPKDGLEGYEGLTTPDILGPFHVEGAPYRTRLCKPDEPGERMFLHGHIYGPDQKTILPNSEIEIWQANLQGDYDFTNAYTLRGKHNTGDTGAFCFESIVPGNYSWDDGRSRPKHIHLWVHAEGHISVISQLYLQDDPYLDVDPWSADPLAKERTIGLTKDENGDWHGHFDVVLDSLEELLKLREGDEPGYLLDNHPNYFSGTSLLRFGVFQKCTVRMSIFNPAGEEIRVIVDDEELEAGRYSNHWHGNNHAEEKMPSGSYECRFVIDGKLFKTLEMVVSREKI